MSAILYKMSFWISCLSMVLTLSNLSAADNTTTSKYFHSGKILAAEITENKPEIINQMPYDVPVKVSGTVGYASVVVALDYMRTIGVYDYSLKDHSGHTYKCIAIAEGDEPFDAKKWYYPYSKRGTRYSLLFKVSYSNAKNEFNLHFNYSYLNVHDVSLNFKKVQGFSQPAAIPLKGVLGNQSITAAGNHRSDSAARKTDSKFIQSASPSAHWEPNMIATDYLELTWPIQGDHALLKRVLGVRFLYTKGSSRLNIKNVSFVVDGKVLDRDEHFGYTGGHSENNDYFFDSLTLPDKYHDIVIKAQVCGDGGKDSYGNIYLLLQQ